MQSKESHTGTEGALNHPESSEWMEFLYDELPPGRKLELQKHLASCSHCRRQVDDWRSTMTSLDRWSGAPVSRKHSLLKWAAAAAIILSVGFFLGRRTSPAETELAEVKASLAALADSIQQDRSASAASDAATAETLRLLTGYSRLQDSRRASDQRTLALTIKDFETELSRLRAELETVAVNTATSFEETHENMNRLASLSAPAGNSHSTITP